MKLSYLSILIAALCTAQLSFAQLDNKENGEFATLSGKVTEVNPDSFQLKVDGDTVLVEMDDHNWDADGYKLVKGDQVVVTGQVDKDFLETKKIEAGSVYVKGLDTYFYANSEDEEGGPVIMTTTYSFIPTLPENAHVDLQGTVTEVRNNEFVVDTGLREVTVETDELIYNPLDDTGYTKIDKGDRVRASGIVDDDFFEGKEIEAKFVAEL